MENRNWNQPSSDTSAPAQIFGNSAAPYINSLVTPGNANAVNVSYASAYHNVLSNAAGTGPSIHPSEPNYLWQEAGSNFGVANDNDPYGGGNQVSVINTYLTNNPSVSGQHLAGILQAAGIPWASYQEDTDLQNTTGGNGNISGSLTSTALSQSQRTVPLASFGGTSASYTNPYNSSNQYNFACKHDGTLFFTDTNGSSTTTANTSTANPEVSHYRPLQQLATDLANNTVARYNLITPDQFNDMHTALTGGFTYHGTSYTGDLAQLAQGDNFLSMIIPLIEASQTFKNNGVIIIWTDETEGSNPNDFNHDMMEIVISPLAKGNAFNVADDLTHSSDLATLQEIFNVAATTSTGYLNDAANPSNGTGTRDMINFFKSGVINSAAFHPLADTPTMPLGGLVILGALLMVAAAMFLSRAPIALATKNRQ